MTRSALRRTRSTPIAAPLLIALLAGPDAAAAEQHSAPPRAAVRGCPEITWIGEDGDWSDMADWSGGAEPTATDCVTIAGDAAVTVTMPGETCGQLMVGDITPSTLTLWPGSGLAVAGATLIADGGVISMIGGSFSSDHVGMGAGGFVIAGGSVEIGSMEVGTAAVAGTVNMTDGAFTVDGDLTIGLTGVVGFSGGQVQIGKSSSGTLTVGGRFGTSGGAGSVAVAEMTMVSGGIVASFVNTFGLIPIEVTGTAELAGTLSVTDFLAEEDTYDVIVAGAPIVGTFDFIQLPPGGEWSWGIDDNRVWIRKGDGMPVEAASWSAVKDRYRANPDTPSR